MRFDPEVRSAIQKMDQPITTTETTAANVQDLRRRIQSFAKQNRQLKTTGNLKEFRWATEEILPTELFSNFLQSHINYPYIVHYISCGKVSIPDATTATTATSAGLFDGCPSLPTTSALFVTIVQAMQIP